MKTRSAYVLGVDGCRGGWLYVRRELSSRAISAGIVNSLSELIQPRPRPRVLAIDVPIGLPTAAGRECDRLARRRLGQPRSSSVFPAPIRPSLAARTRLEACRITAKADGRRVSEQTWAIQHKVAEVDELLRGAPRLQTWIREVHPEVSFCIMNGDRALRHGKKTEHGLRVRRRLIHRSIGDVIDRLGGQLPRRGWADDDLLDACAALWSALRIARNQEVRLPERPPIDAAGLRMEIVA